MNLVNPYINNSLYSAMPLQNLSTGIRSTTANFDFRTLLLLHIQQAMELNNRMNEGSASVSNPMSHFSPNLSFLPMMMNYMPQANIHPSSYLNNVSQIYNPNQYGVNNYSNYYPVQNTLKRQPPTSEFNHLIS